MRFPYSLQKMRLISKQRKMRKSCGKNAKICAIIEENAILRNYAEKCGPHNFPELRKKYTEMPGNVIMRKDTEKCGILRIAQSPPRAQRMVDLLLRLQRNLAIVRCGM